jgi:hypothetical protein
MVWIKSIMLGGWLCLFSLVIAEQTLDLYYFRPANPPVSEGNPVSHYAQADPLCNFFLLPESTSQTAPVPVIREPLFKWRSCLSERSVDPFSPVKSYPELVQDIWRCPAVAIVLYPYHEFL